MCIPSDWEGSYSWGCLPNSLSPKWQLSLPLLLALPDSVLGPFPPKSESFLSMLMHSSINAQKNYIKDDDYCCLTLEFYPVIYLALVSWVLSREQWAWKFSGSHCVWFYTARIGWIEVCLTCMDCPSLHILHCMECCFHQLARRLKIPILGQLLADLLNQSLYKIRQSAFKEVDPIS